MLIKGASRVARRILRAARVCAQAAQAQGRSGGAQVPVHVAQGHDPRRAGPLPGGGRGEQRQARQQGAHFGPLSFW